MAKIYRRSNLIKGTMPKKEDEKARKRNVIMNFRVSAEEKQRIDERIKLSGLSRAEYFINSCLNNRIVTTGNVKTFGCDQKRDEGYSYTSFRGKGSG